MHSYENVTNICTLKKIYNLLQVFKNNSIMITYDQFFMCYWLVQLRFMLEKFFPIKPFNKTCE